MARGTIDARLVLHHAERFEMSSSCFDSKKWASIAPLAIDDNSGRYCRQWLLGARSPDPTTCVTLLLLLRPSGGSKEKQKCNASRALQHIREKLLDGFNRPSFVNSEQCKVPCMQTICQAWIAYSLHSISSFWRADLVFCIRNLIWTIVHPHRRNIVPWQRVRRLENYVRVLFNGVLQALNSRLAWLV